MELSRPLAEGFAAAIAKTVSFRRAALEHAEFRPEGCS